MGTERIEYSDAEVGMDGRTFIVCPRLFAQDLDLFRHPIQVPRQRSHCQSLQGLYHVLSRPKAELLHFLILRPHANWLFEYLLGDIFEACTDHPLFVFP